MVSKKIKEEVLKQQKYICKTRTCNKNIANSNYNIDHIIPKAEGGDDDIENLQALCLDCHADKTRTDNKRNSLKKKKETKKENYFNDSLFSLNI